MSLKYDLFHSCCPCRMSLGTRSQMWALGTAQGELRIEFDKSILSLKFTPYVREVFAAFTGNYNTVDSIIANDQVNDIIQKPA